MSNAAAVPGQVRLRLAHAAIQSVADAVGAEIVHVKGEALAPELAWEGRRGTDVDVLVRPADLTEFLDGLADAGWSLETGFDENSSFGHAAALWHDCFGYVDVHRHYPGLGREAGSAFASLAPHLGAIEIGGRRCAVPSVPVQRLLLLLHAARGASGKDARDVAHVWGGATDAERQQVEELAVELDAELGLAAALGRLDAWADDPRHGLWRVASQGGTRIDEWRARVRAAPNRRAAIKVVLRAPLVNVQHLTAVWGRRPTRWEIVREFFARPMRGLREEWRRRRRTP